MKRQTLVSGLLSLTVVTVMTGCVDDKYDLSNIDTTSRFTVDNLTVPVNLSEIKLENVVNLDDNDLIEKVMIDGKECYSIVQDGEIAPTSFSIGEVNVNAPTISPTSFSVNLPSLPVLPGILIPDLDLGEMKIDTSKLNLVDYDFKMENIDKALVSLKNVKTSPITVKVVLTVPDVLVGGNNEISFKNLKLKMPWGLMGVTGVTSYNAETGEVSIDELSVGSDGKAVLEISAQGLELNEKGEILNQQLSIEGKVGVLDGSLAVKVKNFTFTSIPTTLSINVDYSVTSFSLKSFSGSINYNMDAIHIDPITLNDLPSFLDNPETNIVIASPQILVNIDNPVGKYGLVGEGRISLKSNFKGGEPVEYESSIFQIVGEQSSLAFCTPKEGYTPVAFDGLRYVLSNGQSGLPKSIEVNIQDINFKGDVTDFPLGDLGDAAGSYEFNAPLGFGAGSMVVYESTESGWSSDTLDDVNINMIKLSATCTTNLPVSVQLSVTPIDKRGNEIAVKEESGLFEVPANGQNHPVSLFIEGVDGRPIKDFDGVKFRAVVMQSNPDNTQAIGPDLHIILSDLRVTVDGYYETDF